MTINKQVRTVHGLDSVKPLGLYIHIPFCAQKCNYCDFLSFGGSTTTKQKDYVTALLKEIQGYRSRTLLVDRQVDTVYIGGGTPSLLEESLITAILDAMHVEFQLSADAEITIESNPGSIEQKKLTAWRNAGCNRLSMGAQSMNDDLLRLLGRPHRSEDLIKSFYDARKAGFQNINIDLIFSIPGQSHSQWIDTLNTVLDLAPEHLSFYSLQLEEGTEFYRRVQAGTLQLLDDESDRDMYWNAVELVANKGYKQYEISNASRPGFASRHNMKYWSFEDYIGIGLGAHSFFQGRRYSNCTDFEQYLRSFQTAAPETSIEPPSTVWKHDNTYRDDVEEYLFTGLRKTEGILLDDFQMRFGASVLDLYRDSVRRLTANNWLLVDHARMRLTNDGIDLSNQVFIEFIGQLSGGE